MQVGAALQVVGGCFHSVTREGAFQGTRVAILAGCNGASGLQRPDVASSRRQARLQPSGLDLQYAPNMLAQVGSRTAGHARMSLLRRVQQRHTSTECCCGCYLWQAARGRRPVTPERGSWLLLFLI